ncbi:MAG: 2-oxoglutarate oxidoreductase, partial [Acidiferrobacteraceae bacterium]|nr:2-oxoglutarate oxidoreductase [Acidiferrobacteraceae bacterium]
PKFSEDWLAPPVDQSPVPEGTKPYAWDPETGLASRIIPGQPNGMYCLTGLAHDSMSHIIYNPEENHEAIRRRSLKLAALQKTLKPPKLFGDEQGELLIVGWGGTKGAIEEAVRRVRGDGHCVSSLHIKFLQPMASGIKKILQQFDQVIAVENNWSDDLNDALIDDENRRYSNLAWLLRARFLVDVDCWSEVKSQPLKPGAIERAIRAKLA